MSTLPLLWNINGYKIKTYIFLRKKVDKSWQIKLTCLCPSQVQAVAPKSNWRKLLIYLISSVGWYPRHYENIPPPVSGSDPMTSEDCSAPVRLNERWTRNDSNMLREFHWISVGKRVFLIFFWLFVCVVGWCLFVLVQLSLVVHLCIYLTISHPVKKCESLLKLRPKNIPPYISIQNSHWIFCRIRIFMKFQKYQEWEIDQRDSLCSLGSFLSFYCPTIKQTTKVKQVKYPVVI